jgi:hypothetical protein
VIGMLRYYYTIIQQPIAGRQFQTGHSHTHQDTVVYTQIYFILTSSTTKQWLQKSVTPQGAPFFNLVLASAIHHMNIYVTIKGSQNFNLGSRRAYSIFAGRCKSVYHVFDCITSRGKHGVRKISASKDKQLISSSCFT